MRFCDIFEREFMMYQDGLSERIWGGLFFIALFFTSTFISNAGISISVGLLVAFTIYMHYKNNYGWPLFPKGFLYPYAAFFLLLLLATVPLLDLPSLHKLWRYFYWSLPLFLFYYVGPVKNFDKIYEKSALFSMLVLSSYTLYLVTTLPSGARISGTVSHPNLFAALIESFLPYVICIAIVHIKSKSYNKVTLWMAVLLSVTGVLSLLFTQSRGGFLGFLSGMFFLVVLKVCVTKKSSVNISIKKIFTCILIMTILALEVFSQIDKLSRSYDHERILLWTSSYHMWEDHKLIGVGLANWKTAYEKEYILPEAKEHDLTMPHNVFMIFLSQTGIIGTLGYFVFLIGTMIFLIKRIVNGPNNYLYYAMLWAFITITVHGFVDSGITNKFAMKVFFSYAGVALAMDKLICRAGNNSADRTSNSPCMIKQKVIK